MLAFLVAFEDHPQPIKREVLVVVVDSVQLGEQQWRGVPGGNHRHVTAGESIHVLTDSGNQAVDQTGEAENRAGLHAFDGVLADDRARPGQLDAAERGRSGGRGVRGQLQTGGDRTAEELALRRDHVHTYRRAEIHHDRGGGELGIGGQAVDDPIGAHFLGIVDQQRDPGPHAGFDEDVRYRRPVLA